MSNERLKERLRNLATALQSVQSREEAQALMPQIQEAIGAARAAKANPGYVPIPALGVASQSGESYAPVTDTEAVAQQTRLDSMPSVTEQRVAAATNAMSLGMGDEILTAIGAGESARRQREAVAASRERAPWETMGIEMAATIPQAVASAPYIAASQTLPQMIMRSAGIGAVEGGVAGAGEGEGVMDRLAGLAIGSALGGTVGGVVPAVAATGSRYLPGGAQRAAERRLGQSLGTDEVTPQELLDLPQTGAPETIPEMVGRATGAPATRGTATGGLQTQLVQRPGAGRRVVAGNIMEREQGLYGRTSEATRGLFPSGTAGRAEIDQVQAGQLYDAYRNRPLDISPDSDLYRLLNSGIYDRQIKPAMEKGREAIEADYIDDIATGRMAPPEDTLDWRTLDYTKRGFDDRIGKAMRSGERETARNLIRIKNRFIRAIEDANPDYAPARRYYATQADLQDAFDLGRELKKALPEDVRALMDSYSEPQKAQFRSGALRAMQREIDKRMGENPNYATSILRNQEWRQKIETLAETPEAAEALFDRLSAESATHETYRQVLQGTQTASNLASIDAEGFFNTLTQGLSSPLALVNTAAGGVLTRATGATPRYERALGQMLSTSEAGEIRQVLERLQRPSRMPEQWIGVGSAAVAPTIGLQTGDYLNR